MNTYTFAITPEHRAILAHRLAERFGLVNVIYVAYNIIHESPRQYDTNAPSITYVIYSDDLDLDIAAAIIQDQSYFITDQYDQ